MPNSTMLLSGQYVSSGLAAEFGRMPSSFVPIQNCRLYELQIKEIRKYYNETSLIMTLPTDYSLPTHDAAELKKQKAIIHRTSPQISLLEAVRSVCESHDFLRNSSQFQILFGDTLFDNLSAGPDTIFVGKDTAGLNWHSENHDYLWAGFFTISNIKHFYECLDFQDLESFEQLIELYRQKVSMQIQPTSGWLDFGNITTYYRSRSARISHRVFNNISVEGTKLTKISKNRKKIAAESDWYKNLPQELREHTPNLIAPFSDESLSYTVEYLHCAPLSDLYVFGELEPKRWEVIFTSIRDYITKSAKISECNQHTTAQEALTLTGLSSLVEQRLFEFDKTDILPVDQKITLVGCCTTSIRELCNRLLDRIEDLEPILGYIHGDLCFSNILFDARSEQVKVVDPRGQNFSGKASTYGDLNYDLAKLVHSVFGAYDFILGGRFQITEIEPNSYKLTLFQSTKLPAYQAIFDNVFKDLIHKRAIHSLTALLFISMLPLHYEDPKRQKAFALRSIQVAQLFADN